MLTPSAVRKCRRIANGGVTIGTGRAVCAATGSARGQEVSIDGITHMSGKKGGKAALPPPVLKLR